MKKIFIFFIILLILFLAYHLLWPLVVIIFKTFVGLAFLCLVGLIVFITYLFFKKAKK